MRKLLFIVSLLMILTSTAIGSDSLEDNCKDTISFRTVEVSVDSNEDALAAYQIGIRYNKDKIKIVGLEGGTDGFKKPPFYDRAGLESGYIIIASFVDDDIHAKKGNSRVARLHLQTKGCPPFVLKTEPMAAAKPGGMSIPVNIKIDFVNGQSVNNRQ